jgi:hypothetical protein
MTKGDRVVERAADKLQQFVGKARASGGIKGRLGDALAGDPEFLRKLKPSLIAARAKGTAPPATAPPPAPRTTRPDLASPWAMVGGALTAGYVLAKAIDWRGHAHPRD